MLYSASNKFLRLLGLFFVVYLINLFDYAFSINSHQDGYKTFLTGSIRADLRVMYGDCKKITVNSGSDSYFIPTKYLYEWEDFKQNFPEVLSVDSCISGEYIGEIGKNWISNNDNMPNAHFSLSHFSVNHNESILITDSINNVVKSYSSGGELLMVIGNKMDGENNLSGTSSQIGGVQSAQSDGSGNIWISIYRESGGIQYSKIKKYTSNGVYLLTIGGLIGDNNLSGTSAQIGLQNDLIVGRDNTIYVTTRFPYRDGIKIKRYSSSGEFISEIGRFLGDNNLSSTSAEFVDPNDVVVDKNEDVFIYDGGNQKIKIYSKTGVFFNSYGILYPVEYFNNMSHKFQEHPLNGVISLEEGLSNCIVHYTKTGSNMLIGDCTKDGSNGGDQLLDGINAKISGIGSFHVDASRIYLYGSNYIDDEGPAGKIYIYSLTGTYLFSIADGTSLIENNSNREDAAFYGNNINGITVDLDGNIYVLSEHRIKKYNSSGDWILNIGSTPGDNNLSGELAQLGIITNMVADSSGNLFVGQRTYFPQSCKIKKYSSTGSFLLVIGDGVCGSNQLSGGSARLTPEYLRLSNNNIYAIDNQSRIKVYSSTGLWLYDIGGNSGNNKLSGSSAAFGYILGAKAFDFTNSNTFFIVSPEYNIIKEYSSTGLWLIDLGYVYGQITNTYSGNQAELIPYYGGYNTQPSLRVDPWGSVYLHIRDNYNTNYQAVKKFSSTGGLLFSITGSMFEGYNIDALGNLYRVLYGGGGTIDKFNSGGTFLLRIGGGSGGDDNKLSGTSAYLFTSQVSIDQNGNVYSFPDKTEGAGKIKKYSSGGVWFMSLGTSDFYGMNDESGEDASWGNNFRHFVSQSGNLYIEKFFEDSSVIKIYSSSGSFIRNVGNFPSYFSNNLSSTAALIYSLIDIHFDDYGNVYTLQLNGSHPSYDSTIGGMYIKRYDMLGNHTLSIGSMEYGVSNNESGTGANLGYVSQVFSDIFGNIYSMDGDSFVLKIYTPDGIWQKNIGDIQWPFVIDKYGNYYETNEDGHVESYDSIDNSFRFILDSHDGGVIEGEGSTVTKITYDSNYIFVYLGDFSVAIYDIFGNYYTTLGQSISGNNQLSGTQALLGYIASVRADSYGNFWINSMDITDESSIIKQYSSSGTYIKTLGSGVLGDNILSGDLASWGGNLDFFIDNNDRIIVVDVNNYKIKSYTSSGLFIESIGTGNPGDSTISGTGADLFLGKGGIQSYLSKIAGFLYLYDGSLNKIKIYWP